MKLAFLENGDRKFLAFVTDSELRRQEIARLSRIRRNYFFISVFMFVLALIQMFTGRVGAFPFLWIAFLLEGFAFYDVQYSLRVLQLAEQMNPEKAALPEPGEE